MTPAVIQGIAFIGYLVETRRPTAGTSRPHHHADCGSAWLAEDEELPRGLAQRTGGDEQALPDLAVLDPTESVRADVERVLSDSRVSPRTTVSGPVYDVDTGLVTTIVEPVSPSARPGLTGTNAAAKMPVRTAL